MALKASYLFRPASRPSSPIPPPATPTLRPDVVPGYAPDRAPRSLTRLAFGTFKRASPAPSPVRMSTPTTLVQDGSYLEALSLKLSEAISKALSQPTGPVGAPDQLGGRRVLPTGRGTQLGAVIAAELQAASGNTHLRRAVVRSLQRPMSVMLNSLSSNLLPLLASPAFLSPPAPTVQSPNPNPTQAHAVAFATFAGEVVEAFDEMGLGLHPDNRDDGLKAVREGLVSLIGRVVTPLINGITTECLPLLQALEQPVTPSLPVKGVKVTQPAQHPSITSLQAIVPVYAKALARYAPTPTAQTQLAQLLISLVWRGIVALAHRVPHPCPSPAAQTMIKSRSASSTTPPTTPPAARFALKLPPSRPPSPPSVAGKPSTATDARMLYDLLLTLPRPDAEKETTKLAREAVDEAFDALRSLVALLELSQRHAALGPAAPQGDELDNELETTTADLPTLIALPVMLRAYIYAPAASADGEDKIAVRSVAEMLGMREDEYRQGCLSGFGRAEQCAPVVCRRVLEALDAQGVTLSADMPTAAAIARWLDERVDSDDEAD